MAVKVSRKYDRLTKFLNSVIGNEGISPKVRMSAAETLNSIYSRHEHYCERSAARKERAEVRALAIDQGTPVPPVSNRQDEEDAAATEDARLAASFERFLPGKGAKGVVELADESD